MSYPMTRDPSNKTRRWEQYPVESLAGGINTDERPDTLKPNQVVEALNLIIKKKDLVADTGYVLFGLEGASSTLDSMPKRVVQYSKTLADLENVSDTEIITITKGSVYKFNIPYMEYQYVLGGISTTLTGGQASGETDLIVASEAGFSSGDKIGIQLTNGQQCRTVVSSTAAGHIVIPAPGLTGNASGGAAVIRAIVLNGSDNFPVMATIVPGSNWLVFTNNIDPVKRYNGTNCIDVPNLAAAAGGLVTCRTVVLYNAALFLLNTTENSVACPTRIRRSEIGAPDTWSGGTAGHDDLLDTPGPIIGGDILGPYLIVYKRRTVYRGQFVNSGGKYYEFDPMLQGDMGEGLVSTAGIVNTGTYHLIIGNANAFQYYGDFTLVPIGDAIFYDMFSADANVNPARMSIAFGVFVEGVQEAWFFYPSKGSKWTDTMLRYNVKMGTWTKRMFKDSLVGADPVNHISETAWVDLVGSWASQDWTWVSLTPNIRPLAVLLYPALGNVVYQYDFLSLMDHGSSVAAQIDTRDFLWSGGKFRTDRIDVYLQGTNILIQYSLDQGVTWSTWEVVTSAALGRVQSFKQLVCSQIRFRFVSSDPMFKIRWMTLSWRPESNS
jgi:hypothetical protein